MRVGATCPRRFNIVGWKRAPYLYASKYTLSIFLGYWCKLLIVIKSSYRMGIHENPRVAGQLNQSIANGTKYLEGVLAQ